LAIAGGASSEANISAPPSVVHYTSASRSVQKFPENQHSEHEHLIQ
jgi:hypothetical protein